MMTCIFFSNLVWGSFEVEDLSRTDFSFSLHGCTASASTLWWWQAVMHGWEGFGLYPSLYVPDSRGIHECSSRMCGTLAGLWHFLSVYITAYPPQDYREKKRREQWQEHPFILTPFFPVFPPFFKIHTHMHIFTCKCVVASPCSQWRRRRRTGRGGDRRAGCSVNQCESGLRWSYRQLLPGSGNAASICPWKQSYMICVHVRFLLCK